MADGGRIRDIMNDGLLFPYLYKIIKWYSDKKEGDLIIQSVFLVEYFYGAKHLYFTYGKNM